LTSNQGRVLVTGTALNGFVTPSGISLATDTLASGGNDKTPHMFVSKFFLLPHLGVLLCGTGVFQLIRDWFVDLESSLIARDFDHVSRFAPSLLRALSEKLTSQHQQPVTATIYHFGYSVAMSSHVGLAFDSKQGYEPRVIKDSFFMKPKLEELPTAPTNADELPSWYADLMERQRADDLAKPFADRVGIGGEIHMAQINRTTLTVSTIHRFASYESDYEAMIRKHHL
jgi:hypothetical protein